MSTNALHNNTTSAMTDYTSSIEESERSERRRPPFILSYPEVKLLGIVGVGFFLDAYDLFVINPVSTMLQYRLYNGGALPPGTEGFLKASATIGNVIGQFGFGYAADALSRKAVYGKELLIIIVATILCMTTPTGSLSPNSSLIYLSIFRIFVGIGVGADYPVSASIICERTSMYKRGTMLSYIVSNQGWGSFMGSLVAIIVLACYKGVMNDEGKTSKVDGAWRIVIGLSLIPAFATLYQRLTMPESSRFLMSRKLKQDAIDNSSVDDSLVSGKPENGQRDIHEHEKDEKNGKGIDVFIQEKSNLGHDSNLNPMNEEDIKANKAQFKEFVKYFSEWRRAKLLIGTCACWFLLDVAFYGINLNQNFVLQQIGFDGNTGTPWEKLFKISTGNIIVTVLGFIPGYYVTILTIEKLGRKWIQFQGFLTAALFLAILAAKFHTLSPAAFIVCFALLQFFFNFGANMTIYIIPAELFPTRYRAFAHGISAAAGKMGAIVSSLAFNQLSKTAGTPAILWIFFGCCIAGAGFTLLLPEVRGRDADLIFIEELRNARTKARKGSQ